MAGSRRRVPLSMPVATCPPSPSRRAGRLRLDQALARSADDRPAAVRQGEVLLRAHLDQARGGAEEFLHFVTLVGAIELTWLGRRRGDELHGIVVQRVDQRDEA